jgi:hypothetical protein
MIEADLMMKTSWRSMVYVSAFKAPIQGARSKKKKGTLPEKAEGNDSKKKKKEKKQGGVEILVEKLSSSEIRVRELADVISTRTP